MTKTAATAPQIPTVGQGATVLFPQDSYPYVISKVSPSGKTIEITALQIVDTSTGHQPARYDGPFPVWSHTYTEEEISSMWWQSSTQVRKATLRKDGAYRLTGSDARVVIGRASYYRNFAD